MCAYLFKSISLLRAGTADHVISGGNTSYVAVVDPEGNGCSFICSVSSDFGACLIPENCGFVLHVGLFLLESKHVCYFSSLLNSLFCEN